MYKRSHAVAYFSLLPACFVRLSSRSSARWHVYLHNFCIAIAIRLRHFTAYFATQRTIYELLAGVLCTAYVFPFQFAIKSFVMFFFVDSVCKTLLQAQDNARLTSAAVAIVCKFSGNLLLVLQVASKRYWHICVAALVTQWQYINTPVRHTYAKFGIENIGAELTFSANLAKKKQKLAQLGHASQTKPYIISGKKQRNLKTAMPC